VKTIFCQKLAACLCMKPPPSPSTGPILISRKSLIVTTGDIYTCSPPDDTDSAPSNQSAENDSVKELLREIRDLQKFQVHKQKEQCYEDEREDERKHDWMLAAAVIDRICAIAFNIFIIGGTLIFFILFAAHSVQPWLLQSTSCSRQITAFQSADQKGYSTDSALLLLSLLSKCTRSLYATLAVREMPYTVLARYLVWGNYLKLSTSPILSVCLSVYFLCPFSVYCGMCVV